MPRGRGYSRARRGFRSRGGRFRRGIRRMVRAVRARRIGRRM